MKNNKILLKQRPYNPKEEFEKALSNLQKLTNLEDFEEIIEVLSDKKLSKDQLEDLRTLKRLS